MRYIISLLFCLGICLSGIAQKNRPSYNPLDLDYGTNMNVPEVPMKQAVSVRTHMNSISEAISHIGFNTELDRNKEVVNVIIPCAELFSPNDTVLKHTAKTRLAHFAKLLQYPTMYKILVTVYSDDTGEPEYCEMLTSARANAIDSCLTDVAAQYNVLTPNIVPYGMGQADPLVENNSIENRSHNRRVVISIVPEWEMIETARANKLNR